MTSSVLVNDNHRSEIVIYLRRGKRFGPIMSGTTSGNKENVSPAQGMQDHTTEILSDHIQKGLTLNGVDNDGRHFISLMDKATERLSTSCLTLEKEISEKCINEEASGKIRAATGKAKLLINKKFKQFRGLCEQNLGVGDTNGRRPTNADLEGFWDMVMIQVEEVYSMFLSLEELKRNDWLQKPSTEENELTRKPSLKKNGTHKAPASRAHVPLIRQKSKEEAKAAEAEHKAAARQRLAAAKRMAKKRMQQNGNKSDEVAIFF